MRRVIKLGAIIISFGYYLFCVMTKRGWEHMFRIVQEREGGFLKRCIEIFIQSSLFMLFTSYDFWIKHRDRGRITDLVAAYYADDNLKGYGVADYRAETPKDKDTRYRAVPHVTQGIHDLENIERPLTIVELGVANGDIIAKLAKDNPKHQFVGVDFSTVNAKKKYGEIDNLHFVTGYGLDLLEKREIKGDILYGSSTWELFTPNELNSYLKELKQCGFTILVVNSGTWYGYHQRNDKEVKSRYLHEGVWYHNYAGYLRSHGFDVNAFEYSSTNRPDSYNDVWFMTISAKRHNTVETST